VYSAKRHNQKRIIAGRVIIEEAFVLQLPFDDDYFGAVVTFQSHYHWDQVRKAVKEIYKKLKSGGQVVLVAEL